MLFDIEKDTGHSIVFYFVPDSYSATPSIAVKSNGETIAVIEANDMRPSVVAAGRHETGHCGFILTDDNVPGLSGLTVLELQDDLTGLTIYRRRSASSVSQIKLLRLECQSVRSKALDAALSEHFQLSFADVDAYGRETATQTLLLKCTCSLYVSARLLFKEYELSMDDSFRKVCLIQDPHAELAETLLALRQESVGEEADLNFREQLAFATSADYFAGVDVNSERELGRALARMPDDIATVLSNPLARLLAARTSDDTPNSSYVAASLESLTAFDIVGIRERPETFLDPLAELLGIGRDELRYSGPSDDVIDLANLLRRLPSTSALLDMDLDIFAAVRKAIEETF